MAKHILALDVPDLYTESVFLLNDISTYTPLIPVTCAELQILSPGYSTPVVINNLTPNFKLVLNACSIGIMGPAACNDICPNLPDGIYHIRYSVAPNDLVYVEYNHLRIVHAMNLLNDALCNLGLSDCLPDEELQYNIDSCSTIREFLIAAKTLVEMQNKPADGMDLYRYAVSLTEKLQYKRPHCR